MAALKLREVLPLFSMAVRRSVEELEQRVQALIKEQCTAIHPSVEWRFRQAAFRAMERRASGSPAELEPIVFKNVHPLYAVSDIRGSSDERNRSIQADLITHLRLAREVIELAREARPLPFLDQLRYRIDRNVAQLEDGLSSGDETRIVELPARARRAPPRPPGRLRSGRAASGSRRTGRRWTPAWAPSTAAGRSTRRASPGSTTRSARTSRPSRRWPRGCSRTTSRSSRRTGSTTACTSARRWSRTASSTTST